MAGVTRVQITRLAEKQIGKLPFNIQEALRYWVDAVEFLGLLEVRKLPGYHDEPLKGQRQGQRSVRLNRSYRAIYVEIMKNIEIQVIEVHKHDY